MENVRLELTKAFIIAGVPVEDIPAKVKALEGFATSWGCPSAIEAGRDYSYTPPQVNFPPPEPVPPSQGPPTSPPLRG